MEQFLVESAVFGKIALALLCGFVLGLEREFAQKPAGLRTYMLVAVAGALLTYLGIEVVAVFVELLPDTEVNSDPTRVIQAIVVGISFLGAGTIVKSRKEGEVENLSTSARILVTAGIGITIMLEKYYLAAMVTLAALVINRGMHLLKIWVKHHRQPTEE